MQRSTSKSPAKPLQLNEARIGFVGAGKITEAVVNGLIKYAGVEPGRIYIAAPSERNTCRLRELGCQTSRRNIDIFKKFRCDVVFLAVHGAVIDECYRKGGIRPLALTVNYIPNLKRPLHLLSLVSGQSLERIKKVLLNPEHPQKYQLEAHRLALNAGCEFGAGLCAVDVEPDSSGLSPLLRTLLGSIARLEYVPEVQMDAACSVCGAGLAFVYYIIGALADGAFKCGLSRSIALKFAAKTMACAAQSLLQTGKHAGEMRDSVCSPKGAAIYGLHVLDRAEVTPGITAAIESAHNRAAALSKCEPINKN